MNVSMTPDDIARAVARDDRETDERWAAMVGSSSSAIGSLPADLHESEAGDIAA